MEGTVKRCDQCGHEERRYENTFGGLYTNWITVARSESTGQSKIRAGKSHFCSEKCLASLLNGESAGGGDSVTPPNVDLSKSIGVRK